MADDQEKPKNPLGLGFNPIVPPGSSLDLHPAQPYKSTEIEDLYPLLNETQEQRTARASEVFFSPTVLVDKYIGNKKNKIITASEAEKNIPAPVVSDVYETIKELPDSLRRTAYNNFLPLTTKTTSESAINLLASISPDVQNKPVIDENTLRGITSTEFVRIIAAVSSSLDRNQRADFVAKLVTRFNKNVGISAFDNRKDLAREVVESVVSGFSKEEFAGLKLY